MLGVEQLNKYDKCDEGIEIHWSEKHPGKSDIEAYNLMKTFAYDMNKINIGVYLSGLKEF